MSNLGTLLHNVKVISLVGMAKNSGKTTTLNYLIRHFAKKDVPLALTSIGRDGEELDVVTKTKKPKIFVPKGSVIASAEGLLGLSDITGEVHVCTDINTPMGKVVIVRALSAGFVQLGGAGSAVQTLKILEEFEKFGVGKVLIDGAISRKNISNPILSEAVVLCTGASLASDMATVVKKTRHAAEMLKLPMYQESVYNFKAGEVFYHLQNESESVYVCERPHFLPGAVTDSGIASILHSGEDKKNTVYVAEDPSKVLLGMEAYEKFRARGGKLYVKNTVNLAAITVNPTSPKGFTFPKDEFLREMSKAAGVPVFDVLHHDF